MDGTHHDAFAPLAELFEQRLGDGTEAGASLAVVREGDLVVDLWGGEARPGVAWDADTIVQVWSVTKTMAALTTLLLADRGDLDLDAAVSTYWKDFRRDDVLVRHLLAHTSGYAGWSAPCDIATLLDLEASEKLLAEQEPWFEPGSASGYQMVSYGHLLDGLVRAATGIPLAEVFRTEIAEPLGADFHLGVPDDALSRCADLVPPEASGIDFSLLPEGNMLVPTLVNPLLDIGGTCNTPEWRRVSVAGANGHGNARSVATIHSRLTELLSKQTVDRIFEVQAEGPDLVLLVPMRWGTGFALPHPSSAPAVPDRPRVCWWTGYGGAVVVNDLDRQVTVAYAMNKLEATHFTHSPRTDAYLQTAFACLDRMEAAS